MEAKFAPHALFVLAVTAFDSAVVERAESEFCDVQALHAYNLVAAKDSAFDQGGVLLGSE